MLCPRYGVSSEEWTKWGEMQNVQKSNVSHELESKKDADAEYKRNGHAEAEACPIAVESVFREEKT